MKEIDSFRNDVTYFYGSLQRSVLFFFLRGKIFLACFFVVCFVCFHSNFLFLFLLFFSFFSLFLSIFVYCLLFLFFNFPFGFFAPVNFNVFFFFISFVPPAYRIFPFFIFDSFFFPSHFHSHFIFFFHHLNCISLFLFLYNFINFLIPPPLTIFHSPIVFLCL
ncbi:unnamed protein product [Acanthosepion pharaonis]|uniref:Uncharacterized protein n=1 Tax=Acanthosepion pharaonis TaxID=158019 RepID=A0A812DWU3_ACAPH|nr:unnamed protein product [Sepia pharaonis]